MKNLQILKVFIVLAFLSNHFYGFSQDEVYSYNFDLNNKKRVIVWNFDSDNHSSQRNYNYNLKYSGNIEVSENDRDIKGISKNGYFKVSKVVFGNNRSIEITSDENGKLTKKYFEGKTEGSYEKDGKQWLGDILPDIVRRTGVGAESRALSIYKRYGIQGLLDEIDEINDYSGSVRNLYFVVMVNQINLSEQELSRALPFMEMIGSNNTKGALLREIFFKYNLSVSNTLAFLETTSTLDYNSERGSILRLINTKLNQDDRIMNAYFEIISEIKVNSEKGNVLKHLMQVNKLEPINYIRIFESLNNFSSDRETGAVLISAIQYMPMEDRILQSFIETVEELSSEYYVLKGEIMSTLVDKQTGNSSIFKGNKTILLQLLNSAHNYNSNSQKGLTLRKVNSMIIDDYTVFHKYKECLNSIEPKLEKYNVLLDLLEKQKLSVDGYLMLLNATEDLSRNNFQHGVGAILRNVVKDMPVNEKLIYSFFEIIDNLDQNATVEEALRYLNTNKKFAGNELVVIKSIEALDRIDADIEKFTMLKLLKPYITTREQKLALSYAVKEIDSDYLKRQILD